LTYLHSGRPLPEENEVAHRSEGVGILFNNVATEVWKQSGEIQRQLVQELF